MLISRQSTRKVDTQQREEIDNLETGDLEFQGDEEPELQKIEKDTAVVAEETNQVTDEHFTDYNQKHQRMLENFEKEKLNRASIVQNLQQRILNYRQQISKERLSKEVQSEYVKVEMENLQLFLQLEEMEKQVTRAKNLNKSY